MKKKLFALLLSFTMLVNMVPPFGTIAMAAEGMSCEHHPVHTAECGYVEAMEAHDCTHICGEDCRIENLSCAHTHDETCGYVPAVAEIPEVPCNFAHSIELCGENEETCPHTGHDESCGYIPAVPGTPEVPCGHEHSDACYTTVCSHVHDEACGYAEAVEGSPCTFVCTECMEKTELGDVDHIRAKLIERLYGSAGGWVLCDFDSYTTTEGRHEGIDFACAPEAPIYAVVSGEVIAVSEGDETEPMSRIAIYNNAYDRTVFYFHTDPSDTLIPGMWVEAGDLLGYESNRGSSDYHTHLELIPGRSELASISVNDDVLDNENPYPLWEEMLAEPSFYEQLKAAQNLDALQEVLNTADVESLLSLTEAEVDAVEEKAAAFNEMAPNEEVYENILETLNAIRDANGYSVCTCGTETGEHTPDCPKFGTEDASAYAGVISNSDGVYIGRTKMTEGLTIEDGHGGTAHYSNGVLTLNDFDYSGNGSYAVFNGAQGSGAITSVRDLTIVINGANNITYSPDETQYGTYACGIRVAGHNLIIQGDGTLNVSATAYDYVDTAHQNHRGGSSFGVFVTGGLTIKEGVTVNATGSNAGQMSRGLAIQGNLLITDHAVVNARANDVSRTYGHSNSIGIDCSVNTAGEAGMIIEKNAQVYATSGSSNVTQGCSDGTCNMNICGSFGLFAACGITISGNTHVEAIAGESTCSSIGILTAPWQRSDNTAAMEPLNISGTAVVVAKTLDNGITTNNRSFGMYGTVNNTTTESQVFVGETEQNVVKLTKEQEKMLASYVEDRLHYVSIEPADYPVWVEGIQITRDNWHDVLGNLDSGVTVHFDRINYILYLDGYNTITNNVHKFPVFDKEEGWLGFPVAGDLGSTGVIAAGCDLTIHVKNDSTINATTAADGIFNCGILSGYDLEITADTGKKLAINAYTSASGIGHPTGVYVHGSVTNRNAFDGLKITDVTIDITTGSGSMVAGLQSARDIHITGSSNITARGGDILSIDSFGIVAWNGDQSVSNCIYIQDTANVTAAAGNYSGNDGTVIGAGLYAEDDIKISTTGTVTATAGNMSSGTPVGIWANTGDVVITAGTITAKGGVATVGSSVGIRASKKDILISGSANVTAEGMDSNLYNATSCGMQAVEGKVDVSGNASLTAKSAIGHSNYAILAATAVNINTTGSVKATSAKGNIGDSVAIYSLVDVVITKGTVIANSGEAAGKTYGIYAGDKVKISDGMVTITGGESKYSGAVDQNTVQRDHTSGGIVALNAIEISGGKVTATGNAANVGPSWGLTAPDIKITGGEVIATSGNTTNHYSSAICARDEGVGGIPNVGKLTIQNADVTATSGVAKNQSQAIYAYETVTITNSTVNGKASEAGSASIGLYGNGAITITGSTVTAIGDRTETGNLSNGILTATDIVCNTSLVTALSHVAATDHAGIEGRKLDSDDSVIFTDSIADSTTKAWESSILYLDSERDDESYYGELRDDNGKTVIVAISHTLTDNDVLVVKAGETLTVNGKITNNGKIYVNYEGMMTDTTTGKDYYEIVNAIKKSSDGTLASLTYAADDEGYSAFNPKTHYVEGWEDKERHYAQDNVAVTVTSADPGELQFGVHVWKNADTDTGVDQSGAGSNIKTFTMPPYSGYAAQPVKLIGDLLEYFDLTIIKSGVSTQDADMVFIFHIKGSNGFEMDVSIKGNGSVTIKNLPYDTYTVTEVESWSWRYDVASTSGFNNNGKVDYDHNNVTFANECDDDKWLDGNSNVANIFKKKNGGYNIVTK